MEVKKAKSQQQKQHRINTILNSAEQLFQQGSKRELPSAIQIANQAEVAKGTLYIYFRTKEAIFLGVLERHLQNWISEFDRQLRQYESVTSHDIVNYLVSYWAENPTLGELARLLDATLEVNVDEKVFSNFQTKLINDLKRIVPSFSAINQEVEASEWLKVLQLSTQLLTLAWQQAHPRTVLAGASSPEFQQAAEKLLLPFWQELLDYKKQQPKAKSGWRKFLGN